MFQNSVEPGNALLVSRCSGFWSPETAEAYAADLLSIVRAEGAADFDVLIDLTDFVVQSGPVSETIGKLVQHAGQHGRGRAAIVVNSMVLQMQVKRIGDPRQRFFASEEDARAWLAEGESAGSGD